MTGTVLITGATGYLGGRLATHLARAGYTLRIGHRAGRGPTAEEAPSGEAVAIDLFDPAALADACAGASAVIHLAALNDADCRRAPDDAWRVNCAGTGQLVEAAVASGVQRMVYVSTAHAYATPLTGTLTEEVVARPQSIYAITHRAAEDLLLAAHRARRLHGVVVRLSNAFGAPQSAQVNAWGLLANDLCRQAVIDRRLTLRSPGLDWRDFAPLADVTAALQHLLEVPDAALGEGLFNLGGESPMRVVDFAQRVSTRCRHVLGFEPPLVAPAAAPGVPVPMALDYRMERLKALGFTPARQLDAEVDNLLRFCAREFGSQDPATLAAGDR